MWTLVLIMLAGGGYNQRMVNSVAIPGFQNEQLCALAGTKALKEALKMDDHLTAATAFCVKVAD